jgi:alcohol dehydrogenase YqhD (iron-dependent ADH family)
MENFTAYIPTSLHFGKNVLTNLGSVISRYGNRVLLVYGQGSVKRSGLYDKLMEYLAAANLEVFEYGGIRSNPVIGDVDAAAAIGRENHVEVVLAVGGGSVIDSAKAIALTIPVRHPAWDFFSNKATPEKGLPIIAILTLAATGSEMNSIAVISNHNVNIKGPVRSPFAFPRHSFLDPEVTVTVPRNYTAYGVADLIAHCMEAWFGAGDASLSDRFILAIIREAMEAGPKLLDDPGNYDLRARIMYAATMALNGMTLYGKVSGDWGVHAAGHVLSLLYDVPHGASLTIVYPVWMKYFKERITGRIELLGSGMFGEKMDADESIRRIEGFFLSLGCPLCLADLGINGNPEEIVEAMITGKVNGATVRMKERDYPALAGMIL